MTKGNFSLVKTYKNMKVMIVLFALSCILSVSVKKENVKVTSATQIKKEAISNSINSATAKSHALNAELTHAENGKTDDVSKLTSEAKKEKLDAKFVKDDYEKIPSNIVEKKLKSAKQDLENSNDGSENSEFSKSSDICDIPISYSNNNVSDSTNNESNETTNLKQTTTKDLKNLNVNWYNTKLKGKDLGVNSQGDLYVVGLDGKLYKYEFLTDSWCLMEGDFELTRINRVDVNWDGMPYVTTDIGDTFFLGCDHKWTRLPGCATDIGIGRGGEVYKTGCDKRNTGFGIYRLYCTCPTTCCYKGCQNWRKPCRFCWTHKSDDRKCEWFRIEGNGIKIDVAPSGNPYTIDVTGTILSYDGTIWKKVSTPALAFDLGLSNEGVLYFTGQDGKIYKSVNESNGTWEVLSGEADAITVGPYCQPWVIRNSDKSVLGSSKFEYN